MIEDHLLDYHLIYNHFPPLTTALVPTCQKVLRHAESCEGFDPFDWGVCEHRVLLPQGMTINGKRMMRVWDVIEMCHLDSMLPSHDEDLFMAEGTEDCYQGPA